MSNVKRLSTALAALAVMDVYQQHKQEDIPDKRIWRRYLKPRFGISYSTFLRYLAMPAKKIVREARGEAEDTGGE